MGGYCPGLSCKSAQVRQKDLPAQRFFRAKRPGSGQADLVRTSVKTTLGSNKKRAGWVAFSWGCGEGLPKYQLSPWPGLVLGSYKFIIHKLILGGNAVPWLLVSNREKNTLLRPEVVCWLEH